MTENEENKKRFAIALRLPPDLVEKIDAISKLEGISRNEYITDAITWYVDCTICHYCGAVNNPNGHFCSVCGKPLFNEKRMEKDVIEYIPEYIAHIGKKIGKCPDGSVHTYIPELYRDAEKNLRCRLIHRYTTADGEVFTSSDVIELSHEDFGDIVGKVLHKWHEQSDTHSDYW